MGEILKYAYTNMMQSYRLTVLRILKRSTNASYRAGTLWQADYRGPRMTGWWTGQQKASHGKRRIPAWKLAQEGFMKLAERWKINDVWKMKNVNK